MMTPYEKQARQMIGQTIKDRTVLNVVYKSRMSSNKLRSDWYFIVTCSKGHNACLRKADLMEKECMQCYVPLKNKLIIVENVL